MTLHIIQRMTQSSQWPIRRRATRWSALLIATLLTSLTGCGSQRPPVAIAPPSRQTLTQLIKEPIAKTQFIRWADHPPEMIVASTPWTGSTFTNFQISVMRWSPTYHNWNVVWNGPQVSMQNANPNHPTRGAITSWQTLRISQHGFVIGVLAPASVAASATFDSGQLLWVPSQGTPRMLWSTQRFRTGLMDGTIVRSRNGLLMTEDACWGVRVTRHGSEPVLTHPSCTTLTSQIAGRRLPFRLKGHQVIPAQSTVSVPVGSKVVFWPANRSAIRAVNTGTVSLLGSHGEHGMVFYDMANIMSSWSKSFRSIGTYEFAVIPQESSFATNVQATWVIHVAAPS